MIELFLPAALVALAYTFSEKKMDCHSHANFWWAYVWLALAGVIIYQVFLHGQGVGIQQQIDNNLGSRDEYPAQYRSPYQ